VPTGTIGRGERGKREENLLFIAYYLSMLSLNIHVNDHKAKLTIRKKKKKKKKKKKNFLKNYKKFGIIFSIRNNLNIIFFNSTTLDLQSFLHSVLSKYTTLNTNEPTSKLLFLS
jgi:O-antigen/teichoic acid export membrane protein